LDILDFSQLCIFADFSLNPVLKLESVLILQGSFWKGREFAVSILLPGCNRGIYLKYGVLMPAETLRGQDAYSTKY